VLDHIMHGDNRRMAQPGRSPCFSQAAIASLSSLVASDLGRENDLFDRYITP
jgi:hypothetical protein